MTYNEIFKLSNRFNCLASSTIETLLSDAIEPIVAIINAKYSSKPLECFVRETSIGYMIESKPSPTYKQSDYCSAVEDFNNTVRSTVDRLRNTFKANIYLNTTTC